MGAGKDRLEEVRAFDLCPLLFDMLTPIFQLQVLEEYRKPHLEQLGTIPIALVTSNTCLPSYQHTSSTALFPTILSPSRLRGSSASRLLFLTTPTANKPSPEHLTHRLALPLLLSEDVAQGWESATRNGELMAQECDVTHHPARPHR